MASRTLCGPLRARRVLQVIPHARVCGKSWSSAAFGFHGRIPRRNSVCGWITCSSRCSAATGPHRASKRHCTAVDGWPSPDRPVPVVTHHNHTETTTHKVQLLCNGAATPSHRTSPMVFEFCSGLVPKSKPKPCKATNRLSAWKPALKISSTRNAVRCGACRNDDDHRVHPPRAALRRRTGQARIRSATFSPISTLGACVCPRMMAGITDASATRSPLTPRTRSCGSTTLASSRPIRHVPTG